MLNFALQLRIGYNMQGQNTNPPISSETKFTFSVVQILSIVCGFATVAGSLVYAGITFAMVKDDVSELKDVVTAMKSKYDAPSLVHLADTYDTTSSRSARVPSLETRIYRLELKVYGRRRR